MKIILNDFKPYFRKSYGFIKNLFDGFEQLEILNIDICFVEFETELGYKKISLDIEDFKFSKFKSEKYIEILTLLEEEIRGYISEVIEN